MMKNQVKSEYYTLAYETGEFFYMKMGTYGVSPHRCVSLNRADWVTEREARQIAEKFPGCKFTLIKITVTEEIVEW